MTTGVSICRRGLLENKGFQAARDAGMRGVSGTGNTFNIFNIFTAMWLDVGDPAMLWLWCMLVGLKCELLVLLPWLRAPPHPIPPPSPPWKADRPSGISTGWRAAFLGLFGKRSMLLPERLTRF